MLKASKTKQFERAAELRNQLQSLLIIEERQKSFSPKGFRGILFRVFKVPTKQLLMFL